MTSTLGPDQLFHGSARVHLIRCGPHGIFGFIVSGEDTLGSFLGKAQTQQSGRSPGWPDRAAVWAMATSPGRGRVTRARRDSRPPEARASGLALLLTGTWDRVGTIQGRDDGWSLCPQTGPCPSAFLPQTRQDLPCPAPSCKGTTGPQARSSLCARSQTQWSAWRRGT